MGDYCPHCKMLLQIVLISKDGQLPGGYGGFRRWCPLCQLDPFPAYDPAKHLLEAE